MSMKKISNKVFLLNLRLSIVFFTLIYVSSNLYAMDDSRYWKKMGPEGGEISHFVTNQSHPEVTYASSRVGTYFKSSNAGKSWVALPNIFNRYLPLGLKSGLAADTASPHSLFAYSSEGLIKSTDNAMHWQLLGSDLNIATPRFFSLNNPVADFLTVLTDTEDFFEHRVATSQDGGQHWALTDQSVNLLSEDMTGITILAIDTKNPNIVYGVSYWGGDFTPPSPFFENLYKSIDAGMSWINITVPTKTYRGAFSIASDNSEKLYATFGGSAMVSHNGGENWELVGHVTEGSIGFNITRIHIDPTSPQVLYANLAVDNIEDWGTYANRIAKSYDAGKTWQLIDLSPNIPGDEITVNANDNQKLLMTAGLGQGVLRSENGGKNWVLSNTGINIIGNQLSVTDNGVMYMASNYNDYKSIDAGQSWQTFTPQEPVNGACNRFLINPVQTSEIICQSHEGLYLSKDSGAHWVVLSAERNAQAAYAQDGAIYILIAGDIARSADAGQTWKSISRITQVLDTPRIPFNKPYITPKSPPFQGVDSEIDSEYRFQQLPTFDPVNANVLYAFASGGIFKSIDRGDRWDVIFEPKTAAFGEWKLLINPSNPDVILFFRGISSILLSKDGGESWEATLEPLLIDDYAAAPQMIFDPNNRDGLFGVNAESGEVYHSADNGSTWNLVNKGLENEDNIEFHTTSHNVYAATSSGIFILSEKIDFSGVSDCLFQWAEKEYPDVFTPGSNLSQQWGGYVYRYYKQSNTYLGFFYEQEIHVHQANLSSRINVVGRVEYYQQLTGCI